MKRICSEIFAFYLGVDSNNMHVYAVPCHITVQSHHRLYYQGYVYHMGVKCKKYVSETKRKQDFLSDLV